MLDESLVTRLGEAVVDDATRGPAEQLLADSHVGFLGLHDGDGPFVYPVSFAYERGVVHLHGGPGKKASALAEESRACLAVCSPPEFILEDNPCADNFIYRSLLVYGQVTLVEDDAAREAGLRALIAKYHPHGIDAELRPATLARTLVYRMDVRAMTYRQHPKAD